MPNLTVELFFIVQLLTVRVALDSEPIAEGLLGEKQKVHFPYALKM